LARYGGGKPEAQDVERIRIGDAALSSLRAVAGLWVAAVGYSWLAVATFQ
jgi:hypothetical protein